MSSSDFRRRVAQHPASLPGAVGGIVVTVGLLLLLRIGVGILLDDSVKVVTYLAVAGGGLGAVGMFVLNQLHAWEWRFAPIDFWASRVAQDSAAEYQRQGLYLHVTYGAAIAAFYPRIMWVLTSTNNHFAALPLSLVTATAFALVLFVLGLVYAQVGLFKLKLEPPVMFRFLAAHIIYGLVLGFVTGLWRPLFG